MLTVRLPAEQRERLRARAVSLAMTEADLVRAMLDRELADEPAAARLGDMKGMIRLPRKSGDEWRARIAERNVRK